MVKRTMKQQGRVAKRRKTARYGGFVPKLNKSKMGLQMNVLNTTRMRRDANVTVTALAFAGAADFSLSYLSNPSDFMSLFDVYKIWKVEIQFIPKYNSSDFSSGGTGYGLPTIYVAEDRNDKVAPASVAEIQEYSTCKAARFDKTLKYTCWPCLSIQGSGDANVIDASQKDLWCRTSAAYYNGIKWAVDVPVGMETFRMDIVYKYFITCKDVK